MDSAAAATHPVAERLAQWVESVTPPSLDTPVRDWAVMAILDTVGVTLAGSVEPCARLLHETLCPPGTTGPALIVGTRSRASVLDASLVNGTAAHALDYDDVSGVMGGHPSVPLVAPLMALAETQPVSGPDFIAAFVAGLEVEHRIARAINPHHYTKGWHPTATLGAFAAAAACAHLLRLPAQQTAVALGIAASLASGVKANFGTMTKPLHVGHCARSGLLAALLARNGYSANPAALEHPQGFFEVFNGAGHHDAQQALAGLDEPVVLDPDLGLKQFPCCGSTHPAIAMMLRLVQEEGLTAEQAVRIDILAQRNRLPHTDNPDPRSGLQAKFSIQYATARALADGVVRLEHFEGQAHLDPRVRRLMAMTHTAVHPDMPWEGVNTFGSEVIVTTTDGRRLSRRIDHLVGRGPANPMSAAELQEKFCDCANRVLPAARSEQAYRALLGLPAMADVRELVATLQP